MTDPALPANDPPPPDDDKLLVTLDETGAATHVGCGGDVALLSDNDKLASCDKCGTVIGVECVEVLPEPPEVTHVTPEQFDTSDETPAPLPEPTYRDSQCAEQGRHVSECSCTGDARAPI